MDEMGAFPCRWPRGHAAFLRARGTNTLQWWSAAFSPLCDGILTQSAASGDVIVKSKLAELLALLMGGK